MKGMERITFQLGLSAPSTLFQFHNNMNTFVIFTNTCSSLVTTLAMDYQVQALRLEVIKMYLMKHYEQ